MFLISFLPDWVFHLMLLVGVLGIVVGFFLSSIPFVNTYSREIQLGAILLTIAAVWFEGGLSNESKWQQRVAELEKKVLEAEVKSAQANSKLDALANKKSQVTKETQYVVKEQIRGSASTIDGQCRITDVTVDILNAAARNQVSGAKK